MAGDPGITLWSPQTGDFQVTGVGRDVLQSATQADAADAVGALPASTPILSAAAITAIAALVPGTATAEDIVNALQAT